MRIPYSDDPTRDRIARALDAATRGATILCLAAFLAAQAAKLAGWL